VKDTRLNLKKEKGIDIKQLSNIELYTGGSKKEDGNSKLQTELNAGDD